VYPLIGGFGTLIPRHPGDHHVVRAKGVIFQPMLVTFRLEKNIGAKRDPSRIIDA